MFFVGSLEIYISYSQVADKKSGEERVLGVSE